MGLLSGRVRTDGRPIVGDITSELKELEGMIEDGGDKGTLGCEKTGCGLKASPVVVKSPLVKSPLVKSARLLALVGFDSAVLLWGWAISRIFWEVILQINDPSKDYAETEWYYT